MTHTDKEALKLALDWYDSGHEDREEFQAMIENLLAAPVQPAVITELKIKELFQKFGTGRLEGFTAAVREAFRDAAPPAQPATEESSAVAAPAQEPMRGWWAHTNPETGLIDVVGYQLTQADKAHGWIEQEIYTAPPAQPATEESSAVQPAPVQPVAFLADGVRFKISYDSRQSGGQIHGIHPGLGGRWVAFVAAEDDCHLKLATPPAQPAVPDALTSADIQEHIEYVAGWNDCRQAMLEMLK
jgi:hypothetical protein